MSDPRITTIVADDEPLGRDLVRHMLARHSDIHVVAECSDGEKTLTAIKRHTPRLVFLDIRMPRLDGLSLLQRLDRESAPLIVFITAHDAYALKAFEADAVDYLLKPFDQERFDQTLVRVRGRLRQIEAAQLGENVRHLLAESAPMSDPLRPTSPPTPPAANARADRIVVRESGRVYFVGVSEIEWLEASGNYVALHVAGPKTHLVHDTMTAMETKLDPKLFTRIHRSTIVRIDRIKELLPHFNGEYVVVLKDGVRLKLSRGYLESARTALGLV